MISVKMTYRVLLLLLLFVAVGCSPDPQSGLFDVETESGSDSSGDDSSGDDSSSSDSSSSDDGLSHNSNYSIAGLKDLYIDGSHSIGVVVVIEGVITANNVFGEFEDILVIEDSSGAIQISGDFGDMLESCRIGYTLTLDCTDLWLGSSGGTLILGIEPTGDDVVDAIEESDFVRRATITESSVQPTPTTLSIPQFSQRYISCFICLEGVSFVEVEGVDTFCLYDSDSGRYLSTTHTLVDGEGNSVKLFVPSTAYYSKDPLPSGEGKIYAILEYFSGSYSLRIVYGMMLFTE